MIVDKQEIINKLGKKGFEDFVKKHKSNQPTGHDRTKGIKGRIKFRTCSHGNWVIYNFEPKECPRCVSEWNQNSKPRDFQPYFNMGLGCYVESRQDERKAAKKLGLRENG